MAWTKIIIMSIGAWVEFLLRAASLVQNDRLFENVTSEIIQVQCPKRCQVGIFPYDCQC